MQIFTNRETLRALPKQGRKAPQILAAEQCPTKIVCLQLPRWELRSERFKLFQASYIQRKGKLGQLERIQSWSRKQIMSNYQYNELTFEMMKWQAASKHKVLQGSQHSRCYSRLAVVAPVTLIDAYLMMGMCIWTHAAKQRKRLPSLQRLSRDAIQLHRLLKDQFFITWMALHALMMIMASPLGPSMICFLSFATPFSCKWPRLKSSSATASRTTAAFDWHHRPNHRLYVPFLDSQIDTISSFLNSRDNQ